MKLITFAICLLVIGCSDTSRDKEEEGVFDPMVKTIDRAKEVEEITFDHKNQLDEALKEAEGQQREERDN